MTTTTEWETTHLCKTTKTKCITLCRVLPRVQHTKQLRNCPSHVICMHYCVPRLPNSLDKIYTTELFQSTSFFFLSSFLLSLFSPSYHFGWFRTYDIHNPGHNIAINGFMVFIVSHFQWIALKFCEPGTITLCTIISMKTIHFQFCYGYYFFFFSALSLFAGGHTDQNGLLLYDSRKLKWKLSIVFTISNIRNGLNVFKIF